MVKFTAVALVLGLAAVSALPSDVISRLGRGLRYQYAEGANHLVDSWITAGDVSEAGRFNPDAQNVYHLFTRQNPSVSQPLVQGSTALLGMTNYDAQKRTIVLLHGWMDTAIGDFNAVMVPAFLAAEDVNIIVVDWSVGADTANYIVANLNTVSSGESVARFVSWLKQATGTTDAHYHIVGHSLGGHMAGVLGRNVEGGVSYITGLDPTFYMWIFNSNRLARTDAGYTEVIHTNAGILGFLGTLGDADFYPNGGVNMPGCSSPQCDHDRSFHYMAESLSSGGFTGRRCATYITAMTGTCLLPGTLRMGGLVPKTGSSGIFHLVTNARPPFSRG